MVYVYVYTYTRKLAVEIVVIKRTRPEWRRCWPMLFGVGPGR